MKTLLLLFLMTVAYDPGNRLLVVSAPTPESVAYRQQKEILAADPAGLRERDLRIVEIFASDNSSLRKSLGLSPEDFTIVLIGKDGGAKYRSQQPVTLQTLYSLIDAMPMRQREMRQRK